MQQNQTYILVYTFIVCIFTVPQLTPPTVFLSNCVLSFHKHGMQGKSLVTQQVRQMSNLLTSRAHKYSEDLYFSQANFVRMGYICM